MIISRKNLMRAACFSCAAILLMLMAVVYNAASAARYKRLLENNVMLSLRQASSDMNALSTDLRKSVYAGTPAQIAGISAKVLGASGAVKTALSAMPAGGGKLDGAYKFLSQVGDYSMYLSRKAANGQTASGEEIQNVEALMEYSSLLTENLREVENMISSGEIKLADLIGGQELPFNRWIPLSGFDGFEESFNGYPTLIYDGPFSDHLLTKSPVITKNEPAIEREAAKKIAADYAGVPAESLLNGGDEVSRMPSYTFYNQDVTVGVTINGGFVTYISSARQIGEKTLTIGQGRQFAREFLQSRGIAQMEESYYELASGVLTVNYAYTQDNVVCYTDLIKVGVAMDDGAVVFYDARGFINNHRERELRKVALPPEVAQKSVSGSLEIKSARLALIPTSGENEALTWEFLCGGMNGENVLVYINAETGAEEEILILIENENGVLTI